MTKKIIIIGGGPTGLMAADVLSSKGFDVIIYERKPSFARKFLMAGRGGLNITHSEEMNSFIQKYDENSEILKPIIEQFTPQNMRDWCLDLGEETFIGSSGRVFPKSFKASPLLRAWLKRLENQGVQFKLNHDWQGWNQDKLIFNIKNGLIEVEATATLLSLGGASWPRLGADGSWVDLLKQENVEVSALRPSNCGFYVEWTDFFSQKFKGHPLKSVEISFKDRKIKGEFIVTEKGVEGGAIYSLSSSLRNEVDLNGVAQLSLDLKPDLNEAEILSRLQKPRRKMSLSNFLRKTVNLSDIAIGLLMEKLDRMKLGEYTPQQLLEHIKFYDLRLNASFPIDRAISTAGGVTFNSIDNNFMLKNKEGVFIAGEMLDWEAPTGGYLLQACMANGVCVAGGIENWIKSE